MPIFGKQLRRKVNKTTATSLSQLATRFLAQTDRTKMDSDNLRTAATYINNLLLARGLLRNGAPIDFMSLAKGPSKQDPTKPTVDDQENIPPGHPRTPRSKKDPRRNEARTTTTAHVLNLVHDLILRRDRDQAHLESLSATLSTLKLDASHHNQQIETANAKTKEAQRQSALHDASARIAKNAARSAEASARKLREDVLKTKAVLTQAKIQHDKEIKKRGIEYHKLKQLVTASQRGALPVKGSADAYTIVDGKFGQNHRIKMPPNMQERLDPSSPDYALVSEGKEFLAELSKELSDENESLLALVMGTLTTLRDLMGMEHNQPAGLKTLSSSDDGNSNVSSTACSMSCGQIEKQLNAVLASIRDLLTNPSFAPVEEVHAREEEIVRLREGWLTMEQRWQEAVDMMQSWRRKMSGGDSIGMEELRMGLQLGEGARLFAAASPIRLLHSVPEGRDSLSHCNDELDDSLALQQLPEPDNFEITDDPLLKDLGDFTISTDLQAEGKPADEVALTKRTASTRSRPTASGPNFMKPTSAATSKQGAKLPLRATKRSKVSHLVLGHRLFTIS